MRVSSHETVWLPLLADVAASRSMERYWHALHTLLQAIAPHQLMAASCQLSPVLLGEGVAQQRDLAMRSIRNNFRVAGSGPAAADAFLSLAHDELLALGLMRNDEASARGCVRILTTEQLRGGENFFQAYMSPHGLGNALVLPLWWEQADLLAGVTLYRHVDQEPFRADQLESLQALLPTLSSLLKRLNERDHQIAADAHLQDFLVDLPVGLVLLDKDWHPMFINEEGYRQTQLWNQAPAVPPRSDAKKDFRVPAEVRAAGDRLRGLWLHDVLGISRLKIDPKERVVHPLRPDLKATLTLAPTRGSVSGLPALLVRYSGMASRVTSPAQPTPTQLSILSQLTPGERNVALLVKQAMSNQEIADALHRDITTVKDHLSHIYDKLGIRSRTQLAALLAG